MRTKNISWKWMALLAIPAVLLFAAACDENDSQSDEGTGGAIAPEADVAGQASMDDRRTGKRRLDGDGPHGKMGRGKKGFHGKGGSCGKLVKTALEVLDLTEEQRLALEGLRQSRLEGMGDGPRDDRAAFHEALVKALETGKIDRAALEAKIASKDKLSEQKLAERNARLAKLHATLTPEQRKTLVDAVRAKLERKADKRDDRADDDRMGRKGKRGPKGKDKGDFHGKSMMLGWLRGVELTAEQQAQVDALAAKAEAFHPDDDDWTDKREDKLDELSTLLDAFAADDFDPAKSAPRPSPMKNPAEKVAFHVEQFEALLGILTADQRAQLAETIKSHPGKMGHHGMKGPGCGGDCPGNCQGQGGCQGGCQGDCPGDCPRGRHADCPFAKGDQ